MYAIKILKLGKTTIELLIRTLLMSILLVASSSHAQMGRPAPLPKLTEPANKGPTLEETQQWLIKTFRESGAIQTNEPTQRTRYDLHFSGCNLSVLQLEGYSNRRVIIPYLVSGSLLDMNPEDPSETLGKSKRFKLYHHGYSDEITNSPHGIPAFQGDISALREMRLLLLGNKPERTYVTGIFYYPSPQMVPRINNAWRHAIKLCVEQAAAARNAVNAVPVKPAGELF